MQKKTDFEHEGACGKVYIRKGGARNLVFVPDANIDLICTHPPYANTVKYSEDIEADLSRLKVKYFLEAMKPVAPERFRVPKKILCHTNGQYWTKWPPNGITVWRGILAVGKFSQAFLRLLRLFQTASTVMFTPPIPHAAHLCSGLCGRFSQIAVDSFGEHEYDDELHRYHD